MRKNDKKAKKPKNKDIQDFKRNYEANIIFGMTRYLLGKVSIGYDEGRDDDKSAIVVAMDDGNGHLIAIDAIIKDERPEDFKTVEKYMKLQSKVEENE